MKTHKLKQLAITLFILLACPLYAHAERHTIRSEEGILQQTKFIPGQIVQLKLDETWYSIDSDSEIFICGKKRTDKNITDLRNLIDYRIHLTPSATGTFNKIHVMCE